MDRIVVLDDGRRLGWAQFGDPAGVVVVALHGSPDSRVIWRLLDDAARRAGVRLIAPDRPGFGLSDPQPGRTVLDWVADQRAMLGHLGIERYALIAISAGSPYATAVAWSDPDAVTRLGLFSVIAPLHEPGVLDGTSRQVALVFRLARRAPFLLGPLARLMVRLVARNPLAAEKRLLASRPPADRSVLERPEVIAVVRENIPNQFADAGSIAQEMRLAARDWGFPLGEIRVPTVIWQGGLDDVHPPAMARYLAQAIPGAEIDFEPEFATFNWLDRADDMLARLIA